MLEGTAEERARGVVGHGRVRFPHIPGYTGKAFTSRELTAATSEELEEGNYVGRVGRGEQETT